MARSLTNILVKGLSGFPAARASRIVFGSFCQNEMRYSISVADDHDTHEDVRPTSRLKNSGPSLVDVEKEVRKNPVMIYMRGLPDYPKCGFGYMVVSVLKLYDVPLNAKDILHDLELRDAVKSFSHCPTFPQVFINGEFIGGSDAILKLHKNGELKEKLMKIEKEEEEE